MTESDQVAGSWLRGRASLPAQLAALVLLAVTVTQTARSASSDKDNLVVVHAARMLLHGQPPYADKRFLYLPPGLLLGVPEAELGDTAVRVAAPAVTALLVLVGWWAALRIFDLSPRSRLGVIGAGGFAYFTPFRSVVDLSNWTAFSAAAMPVALLLALRNRWTAAAAVIGTAIALKPMLAPLALLFLFARRWRALGVLLGVPLAASVLTAFAVPHWQLFFSRTLPFLLHGQDRYAKPFDASLTAIVLRVGLPQLAPLVVLLGTAGFGVAWLRWRLGGDRRLRLADTACLLMLSTFTMSRPAFVHYAMVVVPVLLASVVVRGSVARSPWFWIVLSPQCSVLSWPYLEDYHRRAYKDMVMLTGLGVVIACRTFALRRAARDGASDVLPPPGRPAARDADADTDTDTDTTVRPGGPARDPAFGTTPLR